jgi:hypothetical protein
MQKTEKGGERGGPEFTVVADAVSDQKDAAGD